VDRYTRRELKHDELRTQYEELQEFVKRRYREIVAIVGLVAVAVGLAATLKLRADRQQARANAELAAALDTFHAYVGTVGGETLGAQVRAFPAAKEKYQKALAQFNEIVRKYPRTKAAAVARYHVGVCQSQLGDHAAAIQTLREASRNADREMAALAELALAGELAANGKMAEATRLYQGLANKPTLSVPRATVLLAMADAYRATQPAKAREIYAQLEKEFAAETSLAEAIRQQSADLPQ